MQMRVYAYVVATAMTLFSCGFETSEKDTFNDKSQGKGNPSGNDADAKPVKENKDDDLDCSGIELHGSHLTCDQDDVDAQNQNSQRNDTVNNSTNDSTTTDTPEDPNTDNTADQPAAEPTTDPEDTPTPVTPPRDPNIVEFRIKAGTGNGGWNTQAEMIEVKVGQTIRIYNDDTIVHRLHTGGRPCPHGQNIPVGGTADCVVTQTFDSTTSNAVYDHIAGTASKIWIRAAAQ